MCGCNFQLLASKSASLPYSTTLACQPMFHTQSIRASCGLSAQTIAKPDQFVSPAEAFIALMYAFRSKPQPLPPIIFSTEQWNHPGKTWVWGSGSLLLEF